MKVLKSKGDLLILKIMLPLFCIRYAFHIMEFFRLSKKYGIFENDLLNACITEGMTPYKKNSRLVKKLYLICWGMAYNPYFLTLFYNRLIAHKSFMRVFLRLVKTDNSSFVLFTCDIGENFTMHHPFSTIIDAKHIGKNVIIKNNTTIGNINDDNRLKPTICNNVFIGANTVIFGNIHIGNNVTIGAGTVVNKDIPDNAVVVGNPMRIVSATGGYKGW